ncbi:MAG: hypothetical protein EOP10_05055 [Proteobacteria bacterium]|nr:MAG: hypothetical protein EOP10_05055 [Pseudomonadota bacterium]
MRNPQNPYKSSVVRASAGSGKTYQLSRRFLFLVGAGASPSSILTVTFTKKAAAEMRARILDLAAKLLASDSERKSFEDDLQNFYSQRENVNAPRPLSALETASRILASTQSLRISTIDAILLEWLKKFPYESSGEGALAIPPRFDLMSPYDEEKTQKRSWSRTLRAMNEIDSESLGKLLENPEEIHFVAIENRMKELQKHESFLWLLKQQRPHLGSKLVEHPIDEDWSDAGETGLVEALSPYFRSLSESISKDRQNDLGEALSQKTLHALKEGKFITGASQVHGNTFRTAKKTDRHTGSIEAIDRLALSYSAYLLKNRLNQTGNILMKIFEGYQTQTSQIKYEEKSLGFSDLIKGGYYLFSHDQAAGARYLLNRSIRHLLLDEFQDTSVLQWTVFQTMAEEMLSGAGYRSPDELDPTLFIVGDAKQSIYGFREADAQILSTAANFMITRSALDIELSASYRTHPLLLKFVNEAMHQVIEDFPTHIPALSGGEVLIKGRASICISPLFRKDSPGGTGEPIEDEARFIAESLARKIRDQEPVYDKHVKGYRPMRAADCVLLYRNSTHARTYADAIRSTGLSVRIEEGQSFFARPEIRDLMAICRLMAYPNDIQSAFHVLKSPVMNLDEPKLLELLRVQKAAERETNERATDFVTPLFEALLETAEPFYTFYRNRHEERPSIGLEAFLKDAGALSKYLSAFGPDEGPLAAANIQKFLELVLDTDANAHLSWMEVLAQLEGREKEKAVSLSTVSDDAIQLMTIHKAKGLEWPLVVLCGTGEEWERDDLYWAKLKDSSLGTGLSYIGRRSELPMADPHFSALTKNLTEEALRENHRLLYVALTRAQFELIVTGFQKKDREESYFHGLLRQTAETLGFAKDEGQGNERSLILTARDEMPDAQLRPKESKQTLNLSQFKSRSPQNAAVKILAPARLLGDKGLVTGSGSGSGLTLPYPTEAGTYIHKALEQSIKGLEFSGELYWQSLRRHHPKSDFMLAFQTIENEKEKILKSRPWKAMSEGLLALEAELPIAYLKDKILVRGVIDLLIQKVPGEWLIVDYKTSWDALTATNLLQLCYEKNYDKQLALYKEGVARLYPDCKVSSAVFFTAQEELVFLDV